MKNNYFRILGIISLLASVPDTHAQKAMVDTSFVNMKTYASQFAFDMRYATTNNFLKEKVYPCDNCLVRAEVAKALVKAGALLQPRGYKIKFYDCFRPVDVQKKMWTIMPDSRYVANPNKSGSIHNRGAAVDITLVDSAGKELDMGTAFDHFGQEAHHAYTNLSQEVLSNRKLLKTIMEQSGFTAQSTEWWHYNFKERSRYAISNEKLCK
jgi:D-alanyl-D-alanine dipeptidase